MGQQSRFTVPNAQWEARLTKKGERVRCGNSKFSLCHCCVDHCGYRSRASGQNRNKDARRTSQCGEGGKTAITKTIWEAQNQFEICNTIIIVILFYDSLLGDDSSAPPPDLERQMTYLSLIIAFFLLPASLITSLQNSMPLRLKLITWNLRISLAALASNCYLNDRGIVAVLVLPSREHLAERLFRAMARARSCERELY